MSDLRPPVGPPGQVGSGSAQPIKPVIHSHHDQESSALGLIGEGEAWYRGECLPGVEALHRAELTLQDGDVLVGLLPPEPPLLPLPSPGW